MTDAIGVSLSWATFALVFNDRGICVDAPPIARWCIGKPRAYLTGYWSDRGANLVPLAPLDRPVGS